jgi:uncharacterized damage-inducible protein DinB
MSTADPRYPIGTFQFGLPITEQDRSLFLSQIAEAPSKLRAAVVDLSESQLDTPYRRDGWTVRQVVHHLPDGHLQWYVRAKLALTDTESAVQAFSENLWAELPDGRVGPIEPSLQFFEGLHARTVLFFESLGPQDWTRKLGHSERGSLIIQDIVPALAWHSRHHTAHITELRKRMGWLAAG